MTLRAVFDWFDADPMRLLTIIGGSGGAVYWWDRFLGQPRFRVRIQEEPMRAREVDLRFEIENVGQRDTSLRPEVRMHGWLLVRRRPLRSSFFVRDLDRRLEPFTPKMLSATADKADAVYPTVGFRTYTFRPTRGRTRKVRIIHANPLGETRRAFYWHLLLFLVLHRIPPGRPPEDVDAWERRERAKGPH